MLRIHAAHQPIKVFAADSTGLFIGFVTLISPGGLGVRKAVLAGLGGLPRPF